MGKRLKRTERGFAIYGEYKDSRGNSIRVQQSSAVGGPFCWLFVKDREGCEVYQHMGQYSAVSPHLTRAQARRIGKALLRFADGDGK